MHIILDENLPRPLKKILQPHLVRTVQEIGLSGIENGDLLRELDTRFDVFITGDKNLRYQQNMKGRRIAIIELPGIRLPEILPLSDKLLAALSGLQPGEYLQINR